VCIIVINTDVKNVMVLNYVTMVFKDIAVVSVEAKSFAYIENDGLIVRNVEGKVCAFMKK
jgi:hypothetical protein